MAVAETALPRPLVSTAAAHAKPRSQPQHVERTDRTAQLAPPDDGGGAFALAVGSGILFIQACAVIPGLLPCLVLLLPLIAPLVVLGAVAGLLVGVPLGIWRLTGRLLGRT